MLPFGSTRTRKASAVLSAIVTWYHQFKLSRLRARHAALLDRMDGAVDPKDVIWMHSYEQSLLAEMRYHKNRLLGIQ